MNQWGGVVLIKHQSGERKPSREADESIYRIFRSSVDSRYLETDVQMISNKIAETYAT